MCVACVRHTNPPTTQHPQTFAYIFVHAGFAVWTSIFFISYILLVQVVLLNVAVAVLLEGFLSSMADMDLEDKATLAIQEYAKVAGSMDALISTFACFDSTDQLHEMINRLFKHLDVDDSNSVSFREFREGLESLNMRPKLHVTEEDWKHFTGHGKFLDENEELDDIRFDLCMQGELKAYSQRIISHQMRQAQNYCKENSLDYLAHKMQMVEVFKISNLLSDLSRDWNEHILSPSTNVSGRESLAKNSGEGEWKEVRDLLKQLAAEQNELRLGLKRVEAYVCESGLVRGGAPVTGVAVQEEEEEEGPSFNAIRTHLLEFNEEEEGFNDTIEGPPRHAVPRHKVLKVCPVERHNPGENGVKTEVGSWVAGGAGSPAVRAPEEVKMTSAPRKFSAKEASKEEHKDLTRTSAKNVNGGRPNLLSLNSLYAMPHERGVASTYASVRKELIRDVSGAVALTRRRGESPGGGVMAPLPLPLPLPSTPPPFPLPLAPSPSLSREHQEHLEGKLARLREIWSESFANLTFDGTDSNGLPLTPKAFSLP